MATKKAKVLKSSVHEKRRIRNFLCTDQEWETITKRATKFTAKGNISEWLRWSGMNAEPDSKDLTPL